MGAAIYPDKGIERLTAESDGASGNRQHDDHPEKKHYMASNMNILHDTPRTRLGFMPLRAPRFEPL